MKTTFGRSNRGRQAKHNRGFTLVELLVVIGIIAVLVAIFVPMMAGARKQAIKAGKAMALTTIGSALTSYHQDFGTYPIGATFGANDTDQITGSALLGRALLGPGPASSNTTVQNWQGADGADGYGFRIHPGGLIYGPYLRPDKFPVQYVDYPPNSTLGTSEIYGYQILDSTNMPIIYAPARTPRPALDQQIAMGGSNFMPFLVTSVYAMYHMPAYDINYFALATESGYAPFVLGTSANVDATADPYAVDRLQMLLGDYDGVDGDSKNFDGLMDASGKSPATEQDYILMATGPSGQFGFGTAGQAPMNTPPKYHDLSNCDIVTNFNFGQK